jgi:hypothetical protein
MRAGRFIEHSPQTASCDGAGRSEAGLTLVELLIVTVLLPMIIGSLAMAIMVAFGIQTSVTNRVGSSGDAQVVSSLFYQDVQGASMITTSAAAQCGTGTQILGLEWGLSTTNPPIYHDVVSYVVVSTGSTAMLVRNFCASGDSSTPTSSATVVNGVSPTQAAPAILPSSFIIGAQAGWTSAHGVTSVAWTLTEPKSGYSFVLVATPAVSAD